jgi:RNA polymerase-binding transcription factor
LDFETFPKNRQTLEEVSGVVKKKSAAKKKAVGKKSVTPKKKVAVKKKAKAVKKKALPKKSAAKKAKPSPAKPKVKTKAKAKAATKTKVKSKAKAKSPAKPKAKTKAKAKPPLKKKAPTKAKVAQKKVKKAAPKKAIPKKKTVTKTVPEEPTPIVKKPKAIAKLPKSMDPIINKIREKLIENRGEVLKMLESSQAMERDVEGLTFSNEIDLASSLEGREMVFQLSSRDRRELKRIDEVLIKIKEGSYGICETCDKRISSKRLQILPLTTLCIECKESAENL